MVNELVCAAFRDMVKIVETTEQLLDEVETVKRFGYLSDRMNVSVNVKLQ